MSIIPFSVTGCQSFYHDCICRLILWNRDLFIVDFRINGTLYNGRGNLEETPDKIAQKTNSLLCYKREYLLNASGKIKEENNILTRLPVYVRIALV